MERKVPTVQSSLSAPTQTRPGHSPYGTVSVFEFQRHSLKWPDQLTSDELHCHRVIRDKAAALQVAMEQVGFYAPRDAIRRMADGNDGYAGELRQAGTDPVMVTYGWVTLDTEPIGSTGYAFRPPPGDAYLYDFATLGEYRNRGYYPALLRYILSDLAGQGLRRAWIMTGPGNDTSAHSIARAGFTKVASTLLVPEEAQKEGQKQPAFTLLPTLGLAPELVNLAQKAIIVS